MRAYNKCDGERKGKLNHGVRQQFRRGQTEPRALASEHIATGSGSLRSLTLAALFDEFNNLRERFPSLADARGSV